MPVFLGFLGVLAFSFTLPATRVAVEELDPKLRRDRAEALAAVLAGRSSRRAAPCRRRHQLVRLGIVASGGRFGWPLFTAFALRGLTSAHSAVIVGVMPAATAVVAVLRAGSALRRLLGGVPGRARRGARVRGDTGRGGSTGDVQILIAVALGRDRLRRGGRPVT